MECGGARTFVFKTVTQNTKNMTDKFNNKYRIESNRLPGWDYSRNGYYFITIVTNNRQCLFGHIDNIRMNLSIFGKIAYDKWYESLKLGMN